ncbi:MAG: hypothetical protein JSU01_05505 [Bacteroidetes bacterium]|nr:hypothetical protein [Bacteroidota bacterium]
MDQEWLIRQFSQSTLEGAEKALAQSDELPAMISKQQAYQLYGRSDIDRWIAEGLLKPVIVGGKRSNQSIDRLALRRIAAKSNRTTYLQVAER